MIYYLNKNGRLAIGADKVVSKSSQYKHTIMRNDIYIHFNQPKLWQNEFSIKTPDMHFYADAVFKADNRDYFLEVDHKQKMTANKHKLNSYFRFKNTGLWQLKHSGTFPILLFYTLSETRKSQLQEMNPGLELLVYTTKDLY